MSVLPWEGHLSYTIFCCSVICRSDKALIKDLIKDHVHFRGGRVSHPQLSSICKSYDEFFFNYLTSQCQMSFKQKQGKKKSPVMTYVLYFNRSFNT